ncbi:AAA family ATPase [Nocardioides sp.]|uniref:AAA family ATPase n=1 Tax=Nocardioides sp. TaxID=35761 RepID=UPI00356ACA3B
MRLHQLDITAFGPFAETVHVDFDELSAAGLFLLTGATGAGKTSVLDAVCFALYGDVPGERNAAKRLRSDHAAPGVAPRVELEATLSGRRFRIVRSPAWERPKKRGQGTTTQQASVTISERIDGEWTPLSSRLDETGHLMTRLLGMNVAQFTQVAMLPQGRFQSFLRARSEERHRLLQQLFRTGRFDEVERWLRERRLALRRESETAHQQVADLVSRVSEATDAALPESWDVRDLSSTASTGELRAWAAGLRETAATESRRCVEAEAAATRNEAAARRALDRARSHLDRRTRVLAAVAERDALAAASDEHAGACRALAEHRRASGVAPLHRMAAAARVAHEGAERAADEASRSAAQELGLLLVDEATLNASVESSLEQAARVRAALPRAQRLRAVTREIGTAQKQHGAATQRLAGLREQGAQLPRRLASLRAQLTASLEAAARVTILRTTIDQCRARLESHAQSELLELELEAATAALAEARALTARARETWLDLREARLDGMAAEIASALVVGASCPVCGSAEHPAKASPSPGSPDAADEKAALTALDDAKAAEHLHDTLVRDLSTRIAVARAAAGDEDVRALRERLIETESVLAELAPQVEAVEQLRHDVEAGEAERDRVAEQMHALATEVSALDEGLAARQREQASLRAELASLSDGVRDLTAQLDLHQARATAGRVALRALQEAAAAATSREETAAALAEAVREREFGSVEEALAAVLEPPVLADLERRTRDHERRLATATSVLEEPGAAELAVSDAPDVAALEAAHAEALAGLGVARAQLSRWQGRVHRLDALVAELEAALQAWTPLREELDRVTGLASFVDGKSSDNRWQMRLSAYVLAYRLAQVVAAANERLSRMSDQRYSLEHTGRRGAGETRGGLSLLVRDDWTGETRDPATLSGGETFVVSLALALGLADVITQEAGGADLDTLFVDEGFGSLDADTLDDVMDTLDSLRDGGRVVGVVSHVAEMRDRIPTQLRVTKVRTGSTLALAR